MRKSLAVAILAVLFFCICPGAIAAQIDKLAVLSANLKDKRAFMRDEAVRVLAVTDGPRAADLLASALKDKDPEVRFLAAIYLEERHDPRTVPQLIAALKDKSENVRGTALRALGKTRDPRAVPVLAPLLSKKNPGFDFDSVVEALAATGAPAVGPLIARMKTASIEQKTILLWTLGPIPDRRVADYLLKAIGDKNAEASSAAASALGKTNDPRAFDALTGIVRNGRLPHDLRSSALHALTNVEGARAADFIYGIASDAKHPLRIQAVTVLGDRKDARAVELIFAALRDVRDSEESESLWDLLFRLAPSAPDVVLKESQSPDKETREIALTLLMGIDDPRAADAVINALDSDPALADRLKDAFDPDVQKTTPELLLRALSSATAHTRAAAAGALPLYDDPRIPDALAPLTQDPDKAVRLAASVSLAKKGDRRAAGPLEELIKDTDPKVRRTAALALAPLDPAAAVPELIAALRDATGDELNSVIFALGRTKDPRAVAPLAAIAKSKAKGDPENDTVSLALQALGATGQKAALAPLVAVLQSSNPSHRESAVLSLGELKDPDAVEPLLQAASRSGSRSDAVAIYVLGQIGNDRAVEGLIKLAGKPATREAAVSALIDTGSPKARPYTIDALKKLLESDEENTRMEAAAGLARVGDASAVPLLIKQIEDSSSGVRWNAALALSQINDPRAAPALMKALRRWDTSAAGGAACFFIERGIEEAVPVLQDALKQMTDEDRSTADEPYDNLANVFAHSGKAELVEVAKRYAAVKELDLSTLDEADTHYSAWGESAGKR